MSWTNKTIHQLSRLHYQRGFRSFTHSLTDVERTQRLKLKSYLKLTQGTEASRQFNLNPEFSYEEFRDQVPVTSYSDWEGLISRQRNGQSAILREKCERFEPTSGSTFKRKWIPYSTTFSRELGLAASAWLSDVMNENEACASGRHYWSLSWLPTELRRELDSTEDVRLFPFWKRWLLSHVMAVPKDICLIESSEDSLIAHYAYLAACEDLTLLSVWSPTFAIELFKGLSVHREIIAEILFKGDWQSRRSKMLGLQAPRSLRAAEILKNWNGEVSVHFLKTLWPKLSLVSSWDSSTSRTWAENLKQLLPTSKFQGKGLWATEGVVTIPFRGKYPLAVPCHFYEFRIGEKIVPSWQLKEGDRVQPILSTGSGLFRYALQDQLVVSGFLDQAPCFEFIGRTGGVDLVGEKLDSVPVRLLLEEVSKESGIHCVTLAAFIDSSEGKKPGYVLVAEEFLGKDPEPLRVMVEKRLCEFHHYQVARELGQLSAVEVTFKKDLLGWYNQLKTPTSVAGSRKIEPLILADRKQIYE